MKIFFLFGFEWTIAESFAPGRIRSRFEPCAARVALNCRYLSSRRGLTSRYYKYSSVWIRTIMHATYGHIPSDCAFAKCC